MGYTVVARPLLGAQREGTERRGSLEGQTPSREQPAPEEPLSGFLEMTIPQHPYTLSWPAGGGDEPLGGRSHQGAPWLGKVLGQATKDSMDPAAPKLTRGSRLHVGTCGKCCWEGRVNPWLPSWLHNRITRDGNFYKHRPCPLRYSPR